MVEIDRIAVIVKPTTHLIQWLREQTDALKSVDLYELRSDCTTLLIPAFETPEEAYSYIEELYPGIFESELEALGLEEDSWPDDRSFELFTAWFEIEFHSMVYDMVYEDDEVLIEGLDNH